jgi:hypothetical protein
MNREQAIVALNQAGAWQGVAGNGREVMIAVKVNPELEEYSKRGHFEVRTLGESGAWTKRKYFNHPAKAIDGLIRDGRIFEFRLYREQF